MKNFLIKIFCLVCIIASSHTQILSAQEAVNSEEQAEQNPQQAIIIEYVVQENDTLSTLTAEYLGDGSLWRRNAEINPEIPNINFLTPGSTIRLITGYKELEAEVEAYQALVEVTSNEVNKSLQRGEWQDATEGDELKPLDGIRTQANSSAIIDFGGNSKVQINEFSAVFISEEEQENGITRNEIEIEKGEAELKIDKTSASDSEDLSEFEIILGEVRTSPSLGDDGQLSTKARRADNDSSQIMVYSGNSAVESGGVSVDVETGMGTVAKSGEAPSPPEKLLEAPILAAENPDQTLSNQAIVINWSELDTAASYTLALCKDAECGQMLRTESGLTETQRTLTDLPETQIFWRVSGVSASGLDGFASETQSIQVSAPPPAPVKEGLPWYVWLVIIAYALYFIRVFMWYAFK